MAIFASDRPIPSTGPVVGTALVLLAVACLPFFLTAQPPLIDYPGHLARLAIIEQMQRGDPPSPYYQFSSFLVPNVLFDAVGLLFIRVFPIEAVGRIFIVGTLALQLFGTLALHRVLHRRNSYWPLVVVLFLYNWSLFYGFLSYLAGIGLMLCALALWIFLEDRRPLLRLTAGSIAALVVFFSHVVPFIIYAVLVAGYELQAAVSTRRPIGAVVGRLGIGAAQFLAPALLFLGTPTAGLAGIGVWYWPEGKIASLIATMTSGSRLIDLCLLAALCVVLPLASGMIRVRFSRRFGLAFTFSLFTFALMPFVLGTASNLDIRMPLALAFLAAAATDGTVERPQFRVPISAILAILLVTRAASMGVQASAFSDVWQAYRIAFERLAPGAVLFVVQERTGSRSRESDAAAESCQTTPIAPVIDEVRSLLCPAIYHLRVMAPPHISSIASIDRDVFVPQTFADSGVQPIVVRKELLALRKLQTNDPIAVKSPEEMRSAVRAIEEATGKAVPGRPVYLLVQRFADGTGMAVADAKIVASGPRFDLFRLRTPEAGKTASSTPSERAPDTTDGLEEIDVLGERGAAPAPLQVLR